MKILFATDYSDASRQALKYATWLARSTQASLVIAHASEREPYPVGELFDEEPSEDPQELKQLRQVVPDDESVNFEHRLLHGKPAETATVKPAEAIVDFAKQENVDMIVLGTHGRSPVGQMLMGSVAESVVRHAPCPVVTVRHTKPGR